MTGLGGSGGVTVGDVDVSGAGGVGVAVNSTVVTGHGNVILRVEGHDVVDVPPPGDVTGMRRLLFVGSAGPVSGLVGSWLRPDAGVVEAQPRGEVDEVVRWCGSGLGPVVRLVVGVGGQGKTHLAGQVCARLGEVGWLAGFVRLPSSGWRSVRWADLAGGGEAGRRAGRDLRRVPELVAGVRAAAVLEVRTLLVVDYAENVGPVVAELLDTIEEAGAAAWVRVLLLARTDAGWFEELAVEHRLHDWVHPEPLRLGALSRSWDLDEVGRVWAGAVERFAGRAGEAGWVVPDSVGSVAVPARGFATTLDLYATALLTVLDAARGHSSGDGDALAGVLRHEQRQVSMALAAAGLTISTQGQAWAVGAVTLTAPELEAEAVEVVGRVPALAGLGWEQRSRLMEVLRGLYPDESRERMWQAPRPDRLADTHLLKLAGLGLASSRRQWCEDLAAVCGGVDGEAARYTAEVLHRCLSTPVPAGLYREELGFVRDGLGALVERFPAEYVPALVVVDPVGFEPAIVDAIAGRDGGGLTVDQVERVDALLRELGFATTRTGVAVAVSRRLVEAKRPGANAEGDPEAVNRYAAELNNWSNRLAEAGRREEGLAAIEEAVTTYRRLADTNPAAYLPNLAGSLNNGSGRLAEAGRWEEGLAAIEEAVTTYRRLADTNPAAYLPNLAMSLNTWSVRLGEVGRWEEGLTASEEAVTTYRRLADTNPAAYLPDLAGSLNNWSVDLAEMGRREEGLTAIEEAVTICRRLADTNPAAYLPNLAMSLHNWSVRLGEVGRREEGLTASEEAVTIRRRLADTNPAAHLPDLAMSLSNWSNRLAEMGQREEGLTASEEAVTTYRRLADTNPAAHLPNLAASLNNWSVRLAEMGRREEGLTAIEEAVTTYRRLADTNPAAHLPNLAGSLNNWSVDLAEMGRREEGLTAIEEAVTIRRQLADTNPAAHLPNLAGSLNNWSNRLGEAGRREECLTAIEEAVTIRRQLADTNPAAHLSDLAGSLDNWSNRLAEVGRPEEGLAASEEAVTICRQLADTNPAAHLPDLAGSLNNWSNRLAEVGRPKEGLAANEEAVTICRRLADTNPAAYLPDLAMSLHNWSVRLAEVGRPEEGLAASEEAVTICRRLADTNPAAHLSNLIRSLRVLAHLLREQQASKQAEAIDREIAALLGTE